LAFRKNDNLYILAFTEWDLFIIDIDAKKIHMIENIRCSQLLHFQNDYNYLYCQKTYENPSGLFNLNMNDIFERDTLLSKILLLKECPVGVKRGQEFCRFTERFGNINCLLNCDVIPKLHLNTIKRIATWEPRYYQNYKIFNDKIISLRYGGAMGSCLQTWNLVTSETLKFHPAPEFAKYWRMTHY
jgi:hypothetical protein